MNTQITIKHWIIISTVVVIGALLIGTITSDRPKESQKETPSKDALAYTDEEKQTAQQNLDEVMRLAKELGLVYEYDFSEYKKVVYVTDVWYSMDVKFKEEFILKVGGLKNVITDYEYFEVRHYLSNEKVGDLTAFKGVEVYR